MCGLCCCRSTCPLAHLYTHSHVYPIQTPLQQPIQTPLHNNPLVQQQPPFHNTPVSTTPPLRTHTHLATGESTAEWVLRKSKQLNIATRERPHELHPWLELAAFQQEAASAGGAKVCGGGGDAIVGVLRVCGVRGWTWCERVDVV